MNKFSEQGTSEMQLVLEFKKHNNVECRFFEKQRKTLYISVPSPPVCCWTQGYTP